jgi:hypothetical protein
MASKEAVVRIGVDVKTVREYVECRIAEEITRMAQLRDVDLNEWLDGIGFKPANTEAKQLGHELARAMVANVGSALHEVLPAGRDKSLVFTALEDVLMRANRALALGGGPVRQDEKAVASMRRALAVSPTRLPEDPRIGEYKADQIRPVADVPLPESDVHEPYWASNVSGSAGDTWALALDATTGRVSVATVCHDPMVIADICQEFLAGRNANPTGPFRGFVVHFEDRETVGAVLTEIAEAADRAFGQLPDAPL